jgi:hypothetical protein
MDEEGCSMQYEVAIGCVPMQMGSYCLRGSRDSVTLVMFPL